MTVSDFIEMLQDYDGDMPILTPTLGVPTVRTVLGKVVIREHHSEPMNDRLPVEAETAH